MQFPSAFRRGSVCVVLAAGFLFTGNTGGGQSVEPGPGAGADAAADETAGISGGPALNPPGLPGPLEIPPAPISYSIEVLLNPETRGLAGKETVVWTNTTDRAVTSIPMHLYLNAFSHDSSTWFRSTLDERFQLGTIRDRFPNPWGWTEPTSIRQEGFELEWAPVAPDDGNLLDRTLIEVRLAESIEPGAKTTLEIDWDGRLPAAAARTGGYGGFFFGAQWFPKIAGVRPDGTFNRHQFHGPTEFFADFANYDVKIGVPEDWGIAATGKGAKESTGDGVDWHRYLQDSVHDFAFATGADMVDAVHSHTLPQGTEVEIHVFQPKGLDNQLERWRFIVGASLDSMSARIVPYPYETVTVVLPPRAGLRTVGMEYPTFFTGLPGGTIWDGSLLGPTRLNELTIAHEFAHQYFYGIVATNEFEDAFMDEGMTEYWGIEVMSDAFGEAGGGGSLFSRPIRVNDLNLSASPPTRLVPAVWSGPSYLARGYNIGRQFYDRPATTFQTAARLFGQERMDAVFSEYVRRWAFRHPTVEDFWAVAREVGGDAMADLLEEAFKHPGIPDYRVTEIDSRRFVVPYGRVHTSDGPVDIDEKWEGDSLEGLDPAAREEDGTITVEILDPGYTRDVRTLGRIERRKIVPQAAEPDGGYEDDDSKFYESTARIEGPGWDHLPVDVILKFADGAVAMDSWDGKAVFREYRVVRGAPLSEVIIDPEYRIRLDVVPANNGLARKPHGNLANDWAWWMGGLFQWLAEGAGAWL